ncbi:cation:proton antiporter [Streptococcaceae bacterium ESL0687]|nr:cation:proton antiporter [Streptococcaceae bacterium ESL0687]
MSLILQILIILSALFLASLLAKRWGLPVVVGQLLMALIIGPLLGLVEESQTTDFLSEVGVILLMFLAGFEADLKLLKKYVKPSCLVALFGVLFPLVIFYTYARGIQGFDNQKALFLGLVFAATSVSITIEVLQEYKKMHTRFAAVILGAAVLDDILAVFSLSLLSPDSHSNSPSKIGFQILGQLLFICFLFLLSKYLLDLIFKVSKKISKKTNLFASDTSLSLIICFFLAILAQSIGMSDVIGAFFAGLILGQKKESLYEGSHHHMVENNISTMAQSFFIPIFLTSITLPLELSGLDQNILPIIVLTILALLSKIIPAYLAARIFKITRPESLIIGTGMVSRGEMALIIARVGLTGGMLSTDLYSQLVLVIIATTILAPLMLKFLFKFSKTSDLENLA